MKKYFYLFFIIFFWGFSNTDKEYVPLINKALKGDNSVFVNDYLANSFKTWQNKFELNSSSFELYSSKSGRYELFYEVKSKFLNTKSYFIILTFKKNKEGKIVISEIRRNANIHRNCNKFIDNKIKLFVEEFAWFFDVGDERLLENLFFDNIINISYKGENEKTKVLNKIRADFPIFLPICIDKPDTLGENCLINIGPQNKINPIVLSVNLKKYYTDKFKDINIEFIELKDSIKVWQNCHLFSSIDANSICSSKKVPAKQKVLEILNNYFMDYQSNIDVIGDNNCFFEIYLPPYKDNFFSPVVRYKLSCIAEDDNNSFVNIELLKSNENEKIYSKMLAKIHSISEKMLIKNIFDRNLYFYYTINFPKKLKYQDDEILNPDILFFLHKTNTDSFSIDSINSMCNVLNRLSLNQIVYYFTTSYLIQNDEITITGYSVYQDRELLLHHFLKIQEQYIKIDNDYKLTKIIIDLFPYIRTDNVKNIFAEKTVRTF